MSWSPGNWPYCLSCTQPSKIIIVCVWIHWSCCVSRLRFSIAFFFFVTLKRYCSSLLWTVAVTFDREQCICALFMDPQITLFSNFFIKNGSHGTIYTFKNYFATVFSVFSFQFQQNKFYPNRPIISLFTFDSFFTFDFGYLNSHGKIMFVV